MYSAKLVTLNMTLNYYQEEDYTAPILAMLGADRRPDFSPYCTLNDHLEQIQHLNITGWELFIYS